MLEKIAEALNNANIIDGRLQLHTDIPYIEYNEPGVFFYSFSIVRPVITNLRYNDILITFRWQDGSDYISAKSPRWDETLTEKDHKFLVDALTPVAQELGSELFKTPETTAEEKFFK